jgi:hypothetical protein
MFPSFFLDTFFGKGEICFNNKKAFFTLKRKLVFSKKKVSEKKYSKKDKNVKTIFSKKQSPRLRVGAICFSKKIYIFSHKKAPKLPVLENGHFWVCTQTSIVYGTSPIINTIWRYIVDQTVFSGCVLFCREVMRKL